MNPTKTLYKWVWPAHEVHLIKWLESTSPLILNGRVAYQGKKQVAAMAACKNKRVAIDIGAHIGLWSYNLAKAFEQVRAFEPVEAHRECFIANIKSDNVVLYPCALGAEKGSVSINTTEGSSGDSKVGGAGDIVMSTLDSYPFEHVDLVKIDAEGYEENIVRGGEQLIKANRPVILVEQKRQMASTFGLEPQGAVTLLKSWGYKIAQELSGDYLMVPA